MNINFDPCPTCGNTTCSNDCPLHEPLNDMRSRRVRVIKDEYGDEFANITDIANAIESFQKLLRFTNWQYGPICEAMVQGADLIRLLVLDVADPEAAIRTEPVPAIPEAEWDTWLTTLTPPKEA